MGPLKIIFNKLVLPILVAAPLVFSSVAQAAHADLLRAQNRTQETSQKETSQKISSANSFSFTNPWALTGLGALPFLYFLWRINPPKARRMPFPAIRLLLKMDSKEDQPATVPPWLLQLRLAMAALVIVGFAHPQFNMDEPLEGEGPLVLVVDNGWASAKNWSERTAAMSNLINRAEREGREVIILPTAPSGEDDPAFNDDARRFAQKLEPVPWPVDRQQALETLEKLEMGSSASVVWLSNGLAGEGDAALMQRLRELGPLTVFEDPAGKAARLLVPPTPGKNTDGALSFTVLRPKGTKEDVFSVVAKAEDGRMIERVEVVFEAGKTEAVATFDLPAEIRNQLSQVAIEGENSAGAVVLLDENYRRRPVGLVDSGAGESAQPLLSEFSYIEKALDPYVDLRRGGVDKLLERELAVMVLADSAALDKGDYKDIDSWVKKGGTVLRFAGPHLAKTENDELLPVKLRQGERNMGKGLSWSKPARLSPFDPKSPFHDIELPDDVVIERQVLAEPSLDLRERTWARLEDGTPLVTAERRGEGWLVLVHTTANARWSNLALSGLFVDMLRAVVAKSQGVTSSPDASGNLPPFMTLDGGGKLSDPPPSVRVLSAESMKSGTVGPQNPPGFYGDDSVRQAHNLAGSAQEKFGPFADMPKDVSRKEYAPREEEDLTGPFIAGAFLLAMIDQLVVMNHGRNSGPSSSNGSSSGSSSQPARTETRPPRREDPKPA